MFLDPARRRGPTLRAQADELPGPHAPVRRRSCAATATCRSATPRRRRCTATSSAERCTASLRVRHVTQDDAHIFCTRGADRRTSSTAASTIATYLYGALRRRRRAPSSRRGPRTSSAPTRSGTSPEASSQAALERHEHRRTSIGAGEGTFYGPKIDLHMTDALGRSLADGDDSARLRRCRRGSASPTWAPDNREHTPSSSSTARCSARSSASSGSSIEHYARRLPVLARAGAGARCIPVGERHREAAQRAARPPRRRGLPRRGRRARRDARQADPRRRAREGRRSSSSTATASRTRRSPCASAGERAVDAAVAR